MTASPRVAFTLALLAAATLSGCANPRDREQPVKPEIALAYLADKPEVLKRHFLVAMAQGPRNRVLNDMRLGLATLALDDTALSARLFDDALDGIEAVYADSESAERARKLFVKESSKDFKGEPYERVMAYYYRGLLYLRAGDFDNAHASFKGGMLQDSFAESERYRADFGLMAYLQTWAATCAGNTVLARADEKEFREIDETTPLPAKGDRVLVLVETGGAPVKVAVTPTGGDRPRGLSFRRTGPLEQVKVSWSTIEPPPAKPAGKAAAAPAKPPTSHTITVPPVEDIFRQASTRGGREFDMILDGKANFKSAADTAGNVALVGAMAAATVAATSNNANVQNGAAIATGALLLVGLIGKATAAAVEADADTRSWDTLPDRVHAVTLAVPDSVTSLSVSFLSADGDTLSTRDVPIRRNGGCGLAWAHEGPAVPPLRAPFSVPADQMNQPVTLPVDPAPAGPTTKE